MAKKTAKLAVAIESPVRALQAMYKGIVSQDATRPTLHGVCVERISPELLRLTATDGHVLGSFTLEAVMWERVTMEVFNHTPPLPEESDKHGHAQTILDAKGREIEGPYPYYRNAIPTDTTQRTFAAFDVLYMDKLERFTRAALGTNKMYLHCHLKDNGSPTSARVARWGSVTLDGLDEVIALIMPLQCAD